MASDELRCYLIIDASAPRPAEIWQALIAAVKDKPMVAAVRDAAHGAMPCNAVNINRPSSDGRYRLGDFEIDRADVDDLLVVLEAQCALRSITGNKQVKFTQLIQAELREAGVDLGYTPAQAANLSVELIGLGARMDAINEAIAWLIAHMGDWE